MRNTESNSLPHRWNITRWAAPLCPASSSHPHFPLLPLTPRSKNNEEEALLPSDWHVSSPAPFRPSCGTRSAVPGGEEAPSMCRAAPSRACQPHTACFLLQNRGTGHPGQLIAQLPLHCGWTVSAAELATECLCLGLWHTQGKGKHFPEGNLANQGMLTLSHTEGRGGGRQQTNPCPAWAFLSSKGPGPT